MFELALSILVSYLIGSLNSSLILGKINNYDVREHGSGNAGATNTYRMHGRIHGTIVFCFDCFKGFLPLIKSGTVFIFSFLEGVKKNCRPSGGFFFTISKCKGNCMFYTLSTYKKPAQRDFFYIPLRLELFSIVFLFQKHDKSEFPIPIWLRHIFFYPCSIFFFTFVKK